MVVSKKLCKGHIGYLFQIWSLLISLADFTLSAGFRLDSIFSLAVLSG